MFDTSVDFSYITARSQQYFQWPAHIFEKNTEPTQSVFTCSMSLMETSEQSVKSF